MANKNIKGITIEIGGNTTKLEAALKDVNKVVYSTNSELKQLNQALKLDPKNTELLAQKQDVLRKNIAATTERLNTLKEAQRQMGNYSSLTEEQKEQYRGLSVEIAKSENALKGMNKELKSTGGINLSGLKDTLKKIGDVAVEVAKKMAQVTAAIGGALAGLVTAGVKSYADLEQNLGGVETLFGESANKVVENAKNAYKTAGVSANEYMQGVTSFSASLLQSLGGDTAKAADVADMAFRDMSDNANKFGTDMSSIQNAYQGFAKQNYTMLDNLKLGYGGTKTEMERLLKDAEKFSGVKYDINNLSDVYNAIHVIQEELGVTGTTAQEAEKTISGSVASMKAAFSNFLNGSGSPEALAETINNVLTNIGDAVAKLAPSILTGVVTLFKNLAPKLVSMILELLPQLLDAVSGLIDSILEMVSGDTDKLSKTISDVINMIVTFITTNLPKILEIGIRLLVALAQGIAQSIPTLIPVIIDCITTMYSTLLNHLPEIIMAGVQLLIGLVQGIGDAIPQLVDSLPTIIETVVSTLMEHLPEIIMAGIQLNLAIAEGLIKAIPKLAMAIPKIIVATVKGLIDGIPKFVESAKQLIGGLIQGFLNGHPQVKNAAVQIINRIREVLAGLPSQAMGWARDMIQGFINGITSKINAVGNAAKGIANKIKSFLHFSKPDEGPLRDYDTWMPDFMKGLANDINKSSYLVEDATENLASKMANTLSIDALAGDVDSAMRGLNSQVAASINPTVNPNVTYETNYKMMAKVFREVLEDLGIELDGDRLGKFITKTVTEEIYNN
jgi:phage-related protein